MWIRNLLIYIHVRTHLKQRYENIHIKAQTHEISVGLKKKQQSSIFKFISMLVGVVVFRSTNYFITQIVNMVIQVHSH